METRSRSIQFISVIFPVLLISICSGCNKNSDEVQHFGYLNLVKTEEFSNDHFFQAEMPSGVTEDFREAGIDTYFLFSKELGNGLTALFSYYEFSGDEFSSALNRLKEHPEVKAWTGSSESPFADEITPFNEGQDKMEEVFFFRGSEYDKQKVDIQRYASVIGLRSKYVEPYKYLHKYTWPEVLDAIDRGNIRNYTIYLYNIKGENYLFATYEYIGKDYAADMAMVDGDPATIAWIKFTDEICQKPITTRKDGEWWASMNNILSND